MKNDELRALAEKEFAALDIQLYIDTHPDNADALKAYNALVREIAALQSAYEKAHGPLFSFVSPNGDTRSAWVDGPWPWEN